MKTTTWQQGPARAARNVPIGASWAFREHRTMAEIMEAERRAASGARETWIEQYAISAGEIVLVVGRGIGKVIGRHDDGCYAVEFAHLDHVPHCVAHAVFPLPRRPADPCSFSLNYGRA